MIKTTITPAFLIHRRTYKNNSFLLDFFSYEYGKIRLIGRGARSAKTKIQMFQKLNISFVGKSELKTLTNWEADDIPRIFVGEDMILIIYVNELLSRLLSDYDPHPNLFIKYNDFIKNLNTLNKQSQHWLLRIFENNILSEIGYALDYKTDINGNEIKKNKFYQYKQQLGFYLESNGKISGNLLNLLYLADIKKTPDNNELKICRNLNRLRLQMLLGDKPLKSRELFLKN